MALALIEFFSLGHKIFGMRIHKYTDFFKRGLGGGHKIYQTLIPPPPAP